MKQLLLFVFIVLNLIAHSQENKTVTLVVSGQGKTQDEAKQNALRSAIEQAFGAFISSKTEILNDELIKDEIVSVANGNIQKYEIISEVQIPNGDYATSLKATVSVSKLTSFAESKGVVVEFAGNILAANVKQQMLNEQNEIISINNIVNICKDILDKSFDYQIVRGEPKQLENNNEKWSVPINVNVTLNKNIELFSQYLYKSIKEIAMSENEIEQYNNLGKETYLIAFGGNETAGRYIAPYRYDSEPYKKSRQYQTINLLKSAYGTGKDVRFIVGKNVLWSAGDIIGNSTDILEIEKLIKKHNEKSPLDSDYIIHFWDETEESPLLHFRTLSSVVAFIDLINYLKHPILNFQITNGIDIITPEKLVADNALETRNKEKKGYKLKIINDNLTPIFNTRCNWDNENGPHSQFGSYSNPHANSCRIEELKYVQNLSLYKKTNQYDNKYNHVGYKINKYFKDVVDEKFSFLYRPEFYFSKKEIHAVISYYDFLNYSNVQMTFTFNDILSLSEIEKVKEYKISTIPK